MKFKAQQLTGVSETLMYTLYMRYRESIKQGGLINDKRYKEIIDKIDYDFTELDKIPDSFASNIVFRTNVIDTITKRFIENNPECIIVSLASGLDFRHERLDNGKLLWFDVELPHVVMLRNQLYRQGPRFESISASVLDFKWMKRIPRNRPILFIAEGLFMYFEKEEVRDVFLRISQDFPESEMVFDVCGTLNIQIARSGSPYPPVDKMYRMWKWAMSDWSEIESWGPFHVINEYIPDTELNEEDIQDSMNNISSIYRVNARDAAEITRQRLEQSYLVGHVRIGMNEITL